MVDTEKRDFRRTRFIKKRLWTKKKKPGEKDKIPKSWKIKNSQAINKTNKWNASLHFWIRQFGVAMDHWNCSETNESLNG